MVKKIDEKTKQEAKQILDMFAKGAKQIFFKYVLGKFIKHVVKSKQIDLQKTDFDDVKDDLFLIMEPLLRDEFFYLKKKK